MNSEGDHGFLWSQETHTHAPGPLAYVDANCPGESSQSAIEGADHESADVPVVAGEDFQVWRQVNDGAEGEVCHTEACPVFCVVKEGGGIG